MTHDKDARYQFRLPRKLLDTALNKARREDILLSQVIRRFLREWVRDDPLPDGMEDVKEPQ
jgi:hypothetical protein